MWVVTGSPFTLHPETPSPPHAIRRTSANYKNKMKKKARGRGGRERDKEREIINSQLSRPLILGGSRERRAF